MSAVQAKTIGILLITGCLASVYMQCCNAYSSVVANYPATMLPKISDYHIFIGNPVMLTPANEFHVYEPATGLFTDYANKQRLIHLPAGYALTPISDGLPDFPDGTMLVKTFYYFNDKSDSSKGKRLIETRLLIKQNRQWNAGTYVWNKEQTDAVLTTGSLNIAVSWTDSHANIRNISYHVPSAKDCATCHSVNNTITPIGFKIRNLNIDVVRNGDTINQLTYLQHAGVMNPVDPGRFTKLPDWQKNTYSVEERARAYLDINCAHCHNERGSCAQFPLRFAWELPLQDTRITSKKNRIISMMSKGRMPRIGTTIVDEEALALINAWVKSLNNK